MVNTDLDFQPKSADTGAGWDANVDRFLDIESMSPKLVANDGTETNDHGDPFGVNFDLDDGNTWKNRLKVSNRFGEIVTFFSGSGAHIKFGENQENGGFVPDLANTGLTSGIPILGIPTPDKDNSPGDIAVNKEYVDARDELIQREVEVLQEEIEAIAPTTDKGIWQDGASATPGAGHFAMRREGGAITQNYEDTDIDTIIISTTAKDGSGHSFLTEEVGDLIQLFDVEDKNYGLFEIEAIDTTSSSEYVSFDVKWLQGLGETHVDDDVLVKTFAPPTGGTASEFVLKAGDDLTGLLSWNNKLGAANDNAYVGIRINEHANRGTKNILWAESGGSFSDGQLVTDLEPTKQTSITNKKYVDGLFDFSKYEELS
jgi:hypothetical protein